MQEPQPTVIVQRESGSAFWIFGILLVVIIAGGAIYYFNTQAPGTSPTTVIHNTINVPAAQPASGTSGGAPAGSSGGAAPAKP